MTLEEIRSAIRKKALRAIALDTQIIDKQGRRLEQGLLKRMRQFRNTNVSVLVSEIVARELHSHLLADAEKSHVSLRKALKDMEDSAEVSSRTTRDVINKLIGEKTPKTTADGRWNRFVEETGAIIVPVEPSALKEILDRYFLSQPPFKEGDKKHEFPDAFALLSLERWAAAQKALVLVVSGDGDWKSYCEESSQLVIVDDLGSALGCFQDEAANYFCSELATSLAAGDRFGLVNAIKDAVKNQHSQIEVSVDADSQFSVQEEFEEHSVEFVDFHPSLVDAECEPIEFDGKSLSVLVRVKAVVHVSIEFSFAKWDSIDREYISMGSANVTSEEPIELEVILIVSGDIDRNPTIEAIDVQPQGVHLSYTDLEPDWMQHREDED